MIDLVITSDIRIYCEGLGQILARNPDFNIVAIADNREDALLAISDHIPEVVLLDLTMAGGCDLVRRLSRDRPAIKIVALAVSYNESNIVQCAEAGVTCYVPREASVNQLIDAVMGAVKGECYCPPKVAACLLKQVQNMTDTATDRHLEKDALAPQSMPESTSTLPVRLTRREQQIASLLAEGMANKQIARHLSIEVSTVKNHVHNVLVKLGVSSRGEAAFSLQSRALGSISESMDLDPFIGAST